MAQISTPECPICFNFLVDPLSLSCGHSFCRLCILSCINLSPNGHNCALCRARINLHDPERFEVNQNLVDSVIAIIGPLEYHIRLRKSSSRMQSLVANRECCLPIFITNRLVNPGEIIRFHISKPKYKILIQRTWLGSRKFVYSPCCPSIGKGAALAVVDLAEFASDGQANIVVRCLFNFVLGDVWVEAGTCGLKYTRVDDELLQKTEAEIPEPPVPLRGDKCSCLIM